MSITLNRHPCFQIDDSYSSKEWVNIFYLIVVSEKSRAEQQTKYIVSLTDHQILPNQYIAHGLMQALLHKCLGN